MFLRSRIAGTALIVGYIVLGLTLWRAQPASETFDSYRYFVDGEFSWEAVFEPLNGGIATPFTYAIVHDPTAIALVQVFMSAVAWSLLALAVLHRLRGFWTGWVIAVLVLLFSLEPVVWSSHFALASESLMFTAAALWLAFILWLAGAHHGRALPLVATTAAMAGLALTRP